MKCLIGLHAWRGCRCAECGKKRDEGHKWRGCKCGECGEVRDEGHDWGKDCSTCAKCGRTRGDNHQWHQCKCSKCGKRRDEEHKWNDGCRCLLCGKRRNALHNWKGCKCTVCGAKFWDDASLIKDLLINAPQTIVECSECHQHFKLQSGREGCRYPPATRVRCPFCYYMFVQWEGWG